MKNKCMFVAILAISYTASAVEIKEAEKRESFFKNCLQTATVSIQEAEKYKKYLSTPFLLFAMSSCYCGRVASKYDPKDTDEMVQKLQNGEKGIKISKTRQLYESSEAACKKALLD